MSVVALVFGILLLVALVQAAIWIPLVLRWKRRRREFWEQFDASVAPDETMIIPRQRGWYRGSTGELSQVRGNAELLLTSKRLVCCKVTGAAVEVPTDRIVGAHLTSWFQRSRVASHEHLVVELDDGSEVAYFVEDEREWLDRLHAIARG